MFEGVSKMYEKKSEEKLEEKIYTIPYKSFPPTW